jgi:hypothetical protein
LPSQTASSATKLPFDPGNFQLFPILKWNFQWSSGNDEPNRLSFPELRWKRQLTDLRVRRIPFDSANEFFHLKLRKL